MTWGNTKPNGGVLGAPFENCSKSPFACRASLMRLRDDVSGAANRRLFAGRLLCGCETTLVLQQIAVFLQSDVCAAANRRSLRPGAGIRPSPTLEAAPRLRHPAPAGPPPRPPASRYSGESALLTPGDACLRFVLWSTTASRTLPENILVACLIARYSSNAKDVKFTVILPAEAVSP